MMRSASAARAPLDTVAGLRLISAPMVLALMSMRRSSARRRSPSVNTPCRAPLSGSTTVVMPRPLALISSRASDSDVAALTRGIAAPRRMTSSTFKSNLRPRAPPGWAKAKSSAVKPRASSSAMARASPITSAVVVLEVGARPSGQASTSTPVCRWASEAWARVDNGAPVMLTSGTPRRFSRGMRVSTSGVAPLLDSASTQSAAVIIPISPWLASPGCTKKAGVPVLARVAAILPAMWPDLPMPVTTLRPDTASISSQAR